MTDLAVAELLAVLADARALLVRPGNDFAWSSWEGAEDALGELDGLTAAILAGALPRRLDLDVLFAPTGPIQEVRLSSGWGDAFLEVASRFDAAISKVYQGREGP